ncbi:flagellar basal body P-ring formation chaperone FlgA [Desulfolithobacter sp.]
MFRVKLILLTLLFLLPATSRATTLEVTFRTNAVVNADQITLGDIASLSPENDQARTLAALTIGRAPLPGQTKEVQATDVIRRFARNELFQNVYWQGSDKITVARDGIVIDRQRIEQILASYLQQNLDKLPRAQIRLTSLRTPETFTLPRGELQWEVVPSRPEILGSSSFSIIFKIDGTTVRNCTVRCKIEALTEVVTTATTLRRGQIITPDRIRMTRKDIASLQSPFFNPRDVIGLQVKRTLHTGKVIEGRYVEPPPVIRRGDLVKILASRGGLQLTATGMSKMDGRPGDVIRVQNMNSGKLIYCRVEAPGRVSVEF